jgi:ribosomal protein S7
MTKISLLKRYKFSEILKQIDILRVEKEKFLNSIEKEKLANIVEKQNFDNKYKYLTMFKRSSTSLLLYKKLFQYILKKGGKHILELKFKAGLIFWAKQVSLNKNFDSVIEKAFLNIKPALNVKTKRKGSKNIYLPTGISSRKAFYLSAKWMLANSLEKKKRNFYEGIIEELQDSFLNKSATVKNRENLHKLVEDSLVNMKF